MALAHALQGNAAQKEQLLRVQLATSIGNPPVSLLQQCTNILSQVRATEASDGRAAVTQTEKERKSHCLTASLKSERFTVERKQE